MVAHFVVLFVFPALLITAAAWDLGSYTIPNFIHVGLVCAFAGLVLTSAMPMENLGWHLLAGAVCLAAGFVLFARGYVGGGDAKFLAAVALLFGGQDAMAFATVSALFGGALTIGLLSMRKFPLPSILVQPWIARLHDPEQGVPYGVALAAGALFVLPHSEIFRVAALG